MEFIPGAILRRDRGGGQSQMQGGQEAVVPRSFIPFLNLQYRAGPHTPKADTTANTTKQHLKHAPDRRVISLCTSVSVCEKVEIQKHNWLVIEVYYFSKFLTLLRFCILKRSVSPH